MPAGRATLEIVPTTHLADPETRITPPWVVTQDKSGLRCRMEGARLPEDTILVVLQELARSRVVEPEPMRFGRRRH